MYPLVYKYNQLPFFGIIKADIRLNNTGIYNEEMLSVAQEIYPFSEYIFTLYMLYCNKEELDLNGIARFCNENEIEVVTAPKNCINSNFVTVMKLYGIAVYTHTVNDLEEYKKLKKLGVKGIYTDYLEPADIEMRQIKTIKNTNI